MQALQILHIQAKVGQKHEDRGQLSNVHEHLVHFHVSVDSAVWKDNACVLNGTVDVKVGFIQIEGAVEIQIAPGIRCRDEVCDGFF